MFHGNSLAIDSGNSLAIDSLDILIMFGSFVIAVLLVSLSKKIYYRVHLKQRYYMFPRISVKGIANIAMVISIAIVAILLLTIITAGFLGIIFRTYPGWRVTIEGILIKIGGLLFGPIIGMFVGGVTDLLSVALTAGMFHYGYFIAAILYGLLGGVIRSIINVTKGKNLEFTLISTLIIAAVMGFTIMFVNIIDLSKETTPGYFSAAILGMDIVLTRLQVSGVIAGIFISGILALWVCAWIYNRSKIIYLYNSFLYWVAYKLKINSIRRKLMNVKDKQQIADEQLNWYSKYGYEQKSFSAKVAKKKISANRERINWFSYFSPVLVMILTSEALIELFLLPPFDNQFTPLVSIPSWILLRTLIFIMMVFLNVGVIYPVYRIVAPAMNYNYGNDIIESIDHPLMLD